MVGTNRNADELGVVLVWNARPGIGPYGFLAPFRPAQDEGCVLFFDRRSLANPEEPIAEGALVYYHVDTGQERLNVGNIRVEDFRSHNGRLDFSEDDIYAFHGFELGIQDPPGPVLSFIRESFSPRDLEYLSGKPEYSDALMLRDGKDDIIAEKLNSIIGGALIYDKKRFANVELRHWTSLLLKKNPQESELRFLNRLLVEDGIATELPEVRPFLDCSMPMVQAKLLDYCSESNTGRLKLRVGKAGFDHNCFPSGSFIPATGAKVNCRLHTIFHDSFWAYDIWPLSRSRRSKAAGVKRREKPARVPLRPPLQFDYAKRILIDQWENKSTVVPLRLAGVLGEWFEHDPQDPKNLKLRLSYEDIQSLYLAGRIRKKVPAATDQDIEFRKSLREPNGLKKAKDPAQYWATRFGSDLTRWLENEKHAGIPGVDLFDNDDGAREYYVVRSGWHATRPMINRAEVSRKASLQNNRRTGGVGGEKVGED